MQQLLWCWMQAGSLWPAGQPAACMHAVGIGALLTSGFEWSAVCDAYVQRGKVEPAGARPGEDDDDAEKTTLEDGGGGGGVAVRVTGTER